MVIERNGYKVIGSMSFQFDQNIKKTLSQLAIENLTFDNMQRELKEHYGQKNVWFDRDYENNKIIFLTHLK